MSFNSDSVADNAVAQMRMQAKGTKAYMASQKAAFQAIRGQVIKEFVILTALVQHIDIVLVNMDALISTPGIGQAAKDLLRNQAYDIAAEYSPWRAGMAQMRTDLAAFFPVSALTNPQVQQLNTDLDAINAAIS